MSRWVGDDDEKRFEKPEIYGRRESGERPSSSSFHFLRRERGPALRRAFRFGSARFESGRPWEPGVRLARSCLERDTRSSAPSRHPPAATVGGSGAAEGRSSGGATRQPRRPSGARAPTEFAERPGAARRAARGGPEGGRPRAPRPPSLSRANAEVGVGVETRDRIHSRPHSRVRAAANIRPLLYSSSLVERSHVSRTKNSVTVSNNQCIRLSCRRRIERSGSRKNKRKKKFE